jgi:hypothetical protein
MECTRIFLKNGHSIDLRTSMATLNRVYEVMKY